MNPTTSGDNLRVLLADDHPILRGGLRALIDSQPDMVVVGESRDGEAAVDDTVALVPDVVVMDLSMPKLAGTAAIERIRTTVPSVRIIVLTAHEDRAHAQLAMASGASGYIVKRAAGDDLIRGIRAVAGGGTYLDPTVAGELVSGARGAGPRTTDLSEREAEVLRLIAEGHAMKEMAVQLRVSARTLETYRARAMEKLGLKVRADIVRYAVQRGWLRT